MHLLGVCLTLTTLGWVGPVLAQNTSQPAKPEARAITLSEARLKAFMANPGVKALDAEFEAMEGNLIQTRAFPNPELGFAREDFGGGGAFQARAPQDILTVSQFIEIAGKRSARTEAAAHEQEAADLNRLSGRLELQAEVDRRFVRLLGAQSRLRIAAESRSTAETTSTAVAALVQAGEAAPIEELRAQSEAALALAEYQAAQRDVAVGRRALAQLWDIEEPDFDSAEGALAHDVPIPDEEAALARLATLPDLARRRAEIQRLEANDRLARSLRWPDLTLSFGQRHYTETSERAYLAAISIPLPLFDRKRGAAMEAAARLEQGRLEGRAEEMALRTAFHSAHETLSASRGEVRILRDEVLPKAEQVFEAIQEGYRRGKYGLLDLLQAQRNLSEAHLKQVDALVRLNVAKADMERLLGASVETIQGDLQ